MGIDDIEDCRLACGFDKPLDGCFSQPCVSGLFLEIDSFVAVVSQQIPRWYRTGFRSNTGHRSNMKPDSIAINVRTELVE
jgi:hypothetical protein